MTPTLISVRALAAKHKIRGNIADALNDPKMHRVGKNLYLRVELSAKQGLLKNWYHRYRYNGEDRIDALGSAFAVKLEDACLAVDQAADALAKGHDPRGAKPGAKHRLMTYRECATIFLASKFGSGERPAMRGRNLDWWESIHYFDGALSDLAIDQIELRHVGDALEADWHRIPRTINNHRSRLWHLFNWAYANEHRAEAFNPAGQKEIEARLHSNLHSKPKGRHAALPWTDVPRFMRELAGIDTVGALALQLTIRTCKRSKELVAARWPEFDLGAAVWRIPRQRMKAKIARKNDAALGDHTVPLAPAVVELLRMLEARRDRSPFVIPGRILGGRHSRSEHACNGLMWATLVRMGYGPKAEGEPGQHCTVHGFRSTFADWQRKNWKADPTARELRELSLDHKFADDTEEAYARDRLIEERRPLIEAWNDFIDSKTPAPAAVAPPRRSLRLVA